MCVSETKGKVKWGNSGHSLTLTSSLEHSAKVHNEELAKQWSLTLLSVSLLAANNSLQPVVHVHEKIIF